MFFFFRRFSYFSFYSRIGYYYKMPRLHICAARCKSCCFYTVFYNLNKLQIGDEVQIVDSRGRTLQFRVVDTKVYDSEAAACEVFLSEPSRARLNLITCGGDWDATRKLYSDRIVVFTELVTTD